MEKEGRGTSWGRGHQGLKYCPRLRWKRSIAPGGRNLGSNSAALIRTIAKRGRGRGGAIRWWRRIREIRGIRGIVGRIRRGGIIIGVRARGIRARVIIIRLRKRGRTLVKRRTQFGRIKRGIKSGKAKFKAIAKHFPKIYNKQIGRGYQWYPILNEKNLIFACKMVKKTLIRSNKQFPAIRRTVETKISNFTTHSNFSQVNSSWFYEIISNRQK